jgi:hypothetical protein
LPAAARLGLAVARLQSLVVRRAAVTGLPHERGVVAIVVPVDGMAHGDTGAEEQDASDCCASDLGGAA